MPADSAVRLFTYDHPLRSRTLRGKLEQERKNLIEVMAIGYAQDWADYKHRIGVIEGLKKAIDICAEEEKKLGAE